MLPSKSCTVAEKEEASARELDNIYFGPWPMTRDEMTERKS
jgi:hypothetical protein